MIASKVDKFAPGSVWQKVDTTNGDYIVKKRGKRAKGVDRNATLYFDYDVIVLTNCGYTMWAYVCELNNPRKWTWKKQKDEDTLEPLLGRIPDEKFAAGNVWKNRSSNRLYTIDHVENVTEPLTSFTYTKRVYFEPPTPRGAICHAWMTDMRNPLMWTWISQRRDVPETLKPGIHPKETPSTTGQVEANCSCELKSLREQCAKLLAENKALRGRLENVATWAQTIMNNAVIK